MTVSPSSSGPGAQTPDGCSVDLYCRVPDLADLQDIDSELLRFSLEQGDIEGLLAACGLNGCRWLGEQGLGVSAVACHIVVPC